jgi:apolipoprotein D and lipocalin family protein
MNNLPEQKPVPHVDINRYMGVWHVIAAIPTPFDGTYNPVEHYSWNEKEHRIDVDYHYNSGAPNGPLKHIRQKAFVESSSGSEWKVQIIWPFKASYLILDLTEDYAEVIVGVPSRKYAWIMSREKTMPQPRLEECKRKLSLLGYDLAKLKPAINN